MKLTKNFIPVFSLLILSACNLSVDTNGKQLFDISRPYIINFNSSTHNFTAIFSDYPKSTVEQDNEEFYELSASYAQLPEPLQNYKGLKLVGHNHSDDLLMAVKGEVQGLEPHALYRVFIRAEFATATPSNCFGVGGAPGESVFIKLGASKIEPKNTNENGMYRLNVDIGQQSTSGTQGQTVGNIANGRNCEEQQQFVLKSLSTTQSIDVIANEHGRFWLIAATDSGFEGLTEIYFTKFTVTIAR